MQGLEFIPSMKIKAAWEQNNGEKLGKYKINTAWAPTEGFSHPTGHII